MKKLLGIVVLGLLFFSTVNAEERESELNNLFKQLKNSEATKAIEIENKKQNKIKNITLDDNKFLQIEKNLSNPARLVLG